MVVSLAIAGVVAIGLLVYMLILFFAWSDLRDRTETARNEVQAMVNKKPAPGKENEERIQKDIELYQDKSKDIVDTFKSPLRPAIDAFLAELPPPLVSALNDEEKDAYKEPGTGIEGDDETPAVPLKIRKLSYDDFRKFFVARFEAFCTERNYNEDRDRFSLKTLSEFRTKCANLFPAGSWKKAMDKFFEKAKTLTYEPIDEADPLPTLLVGFGMPRRVSDNKMQLAKQVDEIIVRKIKPMAEKGHLFLEEKAFDFVGGASENKGTSSDTKKVGIEDYPHAFFHWDVFGDIVHRLCLGKATSLRRVILRTAPVEGGSDGNQNSSSVNFNAAFDTDGNYRLYHYTVVFTASMESVREVVRTFDSAWKDRRMYLVRGIALYTNENNAALIMKQVTGDQKDTRNTPVNVERPTRRRRRVSQAEEQVTENTENKEENVEMSESEKRELHYRIIIQREQKKLEKSGEKEPDENSILAKEEVKDFIEMVRQAPDAGSRNQQEKDELLDKMEKVIPPNLQYGYRKVLVGDEKNVKHCLVYLDIDYVVLEQNE